MDKESDFKLFIGKDGQKYRTYAELIVANTLYEQNVINKSNDIKEKGYFLGKDGEYYHSSMEMMVANAVYEQQKILKNNIKNK